MLFCRKGTLTFNSCELEIVELGEDTAELIGEVKHEDTAELNGEVKLGVSPSTSFPYTSISFSTPLSI